MQTVCQKQIKMKNFLMPGRLWAPVFMMAGISILSGTAGVSAGPLSFAGIDKLAHLLVFGLLSVAWVRTFPGEFLRPVHRLLLAVLATTLFGLADELHQLGNPLRTFEWADLGADFVGSLLGALGYLQISWWRAFLEVEIKDALRLRFAAKEANSAR